jgi:hypothetical protein
VIASRLYVSTDITLEHDPGQREANFMEFPPKYRQRIEAEFEF